MTTYALVRICQTSFGYKTSNGFVPVISDVSFELTPGEFIILEGPNGCGKTTILKALLRMGALYKGDVVLNVSLSEIGYIPQEAAVESDAPVCSADVIKSAFPFCKVTDDVVKAALSRVGLENVEKRRYGALSGGQRRRVLLARALAYNAKLIILDEPTVNVDKETELLLENLLLELIKKEEKAVLAVTHSERWAKSARRISLIKKELK